MTDKKPSQPFTWIWFNPTRMFQFLAANLAPVRWLTLFIWPFAIFAGIATISNWYEMLAHIERLLLKLSFWESILAGLLTTNLASKLAVGIVMSYYRAYPQGFGITLLLGLIPRFYVDRSPIKKLELAQQKTCYSSTLLVKVLLFAVGMLVWAITRRTGSGASEIFLALGISGFSSFVFTANPLLPLDGCKWLCAWLKKPTLYRDSLHMTYMIATRRPTPSGLAPGAKVGMVLFALAAIGFTAVLIYSVLSVVSSGLERQFQGAGVLIFCFLIAVTIFFLISRVTSRKSSKAKANRSAGAGKNAGRAKQRNLAVTRD